MNTEDLLSKVKAATRQTLTKPRICQSRLLWNGPEQNEALLVTHWIENQPTADAVRLEWNDEFIDCRLSKASALENARDAKIGVVFTAALHFPEDSMQAFELLRSGSMPSLVLLKNGKPISNELTVQQVQTGKGLELEKKRC